MQESNFFDDLTPSGPDQWLKDQEAQKAKGEHLDYLIHKTFKQGESGAELLAIWKESLIMAPTADGGLDQVQIGINEGQKRFIRAILLTIKRVENE